MSGNSQRKRNIIFIITLSSFIAIGSWAFVKLHRFENVFGMNTYVSSNHVGKSARGDAPVAPPTSQGLTAQQRQHFTGLLNGLLTNVSSATNDYKARRTVLNDLVQPTNLRQASFIDENALQMRALIPELKNSSNTVLKLFEKGDVDFITWTRTLPTDKRAFALEKWKEMDCGRGVPGNMPSNLDRPCGHQGLAQWLRRSYRALAR